MLTRDDVVIAGLQAATLATLRAVMAEQMHGGQFPDGPLAGCWWGIEKVEAGFHIILTDADRGRGIQYVSHLGSGISGVEGDGDLLLVVTTRMCPDIGTILAEADGLCREADRVRRRVIRGEGEPSEASDILGEAAAWHRSWGAVVAHGDIPLRAVEVLRNTANCVTAATDRMTRTIVAFVDYYAVGVADGDDEESRH